MGASFQHEVGENRIEFEGGVMVPWNRRRRGDRSEAIFREVVEDCEAFLAGRLVELLECRKALVPPWAWTNLLAHGSVEQLRTVSLEEHFRSGDEYREWREGRSYLATETLAAARSFGPLLVVQKALISLELSLAAHPASNMSSPPQWVAHVEALLKVHRATRMRATNPGSYRKQQNGDGQ